MITLNFYKQRGNEGRFLLIYDDPCDGAARRFVNSTDDSITSATICIGDVTATLTMTDITANCNGLTGSAIRFGLTLTDDQMNQLGTLEQGAVILDGERINETMKIFVYDK